jgi:pSer/pThr/pTyr-binding forkhead associated (FHA) protein
MPRVDGYNELRLRFEPYRTRSYRVQASTPTAEASAAFELPFNELELENFILKVGRPRGRRRIDSTAVGDARRFGDGLFRAVFRDQVYALYHEALDDAQRSERGLRITLCLSGSPELIDVPWEYLFDDPKFLAVSAYTPIVRYLDLPRAHRPLLVKPPLRLLGIVSDPAEYERLDIERERANLEAALADLSRDAKVELHWLEKPTLGSLLRALEAQTFHALHYIGHGAYDHDAGRGVLVFEDSGGWAHPVDSAQLGTVLQDFSSLRLAVLNACDGARTARTDPFAGVAGSLVQRDIPAVVAMQFEISDEAAVVFASAFYQRLAAGSAVDSSVAAARLAMFAERGDQIEWGTPVLFMRVRDGQIFDFAGEPRMAAPGGNSSDASVGVRGAETSIHSLRGAERGSERAEVPIPIRSEDEQGSDVMADRGSPTAGDREARERHDRLVAERSGAPHLIYRDEHGLQTIRLLDASQPSVTIGRHLPAERGVSIDWDGEVSRRHATLSAEDDDWTVVDNGSRNGTFVNGQCVQTRRHLRNGDTLAIGQTSILFRTPARADGYTTRPGRDAQAQYDVSELDRRLLAALCRPLKEPGRTLPASNAAIAEELSLSVAAVKKKLSVLFVRFGLDRLPRAEKRTRLAVAAMQSGLVTTGDL